MQVRLALVPVLALFAVAAPVAQAAPKAKPGCQTITDDTGDTFAVRVQDSQGAYGPQEDGLDITSADLASDGKGVTAAVRIAALSRAIATSPQGFTVGLDFSIGSSASIVRSSEAQSATVSRGVPPITSTPGQPMTTRGPFADIAAGGKTVTVGTASCVVPGK